MKKLILILIVFLNLNAYAFANSFPDVPEDHKFYAAIESLKNLEIINGYPDGTFKPEEQVNRVEALKMILESAQIISPDSQSDTGFPDVPTDSWFFKYVANAKKLGIVNGNADGTFAPDRQVNKAEFIKMTLETFDIDLSKHQNLSEAISDDTGANEWFSPYFSYAKLVGIISPSPENLLEPDKYLSRGECAEIIYRMLILNRGGDTQKMLSIAESQLITVLFELNDNNIVKALESANSAVFYTEQALSMEPAEGIVKAANKIALGFKELCLAYQAGLEEDYDKLIEHANNAETYAGEAYNDDNSTQPLGIKIKEQANLLKSQISQ
ncbi:hypothetical protein GF354_05220 [Candidatus Peregrinibacteria bacterium]|nr:hypothetical protein [Candidatus Peregrinibacteria bacterium]